MFGFPLSHFGPPWNLFLRDYCRPCVDSDQFYSKEASTELSGHSKMNVFCPSFPVDILFNRWNTPRSTVRSIQGYILSIHHDLEGARFLIGPVVELVGTCWGWTNCIIRPILIDDEGALLADGS